MTQQRLGSRHAGSRNDPDGSGSTQQMSKSVNKSSNIFSEVTFDCLALSINYLFLLLINGLSRLISIHKWLLTVDMM